jgi:hypothetical protein
VKQTQNSFQVDAESSAHTLHLIAEWGKGLNHQEGLNISLPDLIFSAWSIKRGYTTNPRTWGFAIASGG